ncbi:putative Subtilisin-like serine protease [Seiridium cardinale]|uniref:Subtilisin-like serine protease n=1 Tax=Seiridium cardinale TaxID=138064 RepID=A0ABR2XMI3_9PEZI
MAPERVCLCAYSGGLDISTILRWSALRGNEVVCFLANCDQEDDYKAVNSKALQLGAERMIIQDAQQELIDELVWAAIQCNAIYEDRYGLLWTSLARPVIARAVVKVAKEYSCTIDCAMSQPPKHVELSNTIVARYTNHRAVHHSYTPPFSSSNSIIAAPSEPLRVRDGAVLLDPRAQTQASLETELTTPKLDRIHDLLWLAGLVRPARPLHRQLVLGRRIVLTELPDEHLVWHQTSMFVKPLPEYLLSHAYWEAQLCHDPRLYRGACGLLLSYGWLIGHKSDFRIAREAGLLPDQVTWENWVALMREAITFLGGMNPRIVGERYQYGELRLSRLTKIYRFSPGIISFRTLTHGYMSHSTWRTALFQRNFGWLLVAFIYLSTVLSAIQVGLATNRLQADVRFQKMSLVIAIMAIVLVTASVLLIAILWAWLFWCHIWHTRQYNKRARRKEAMG